MGKSSIKKSNKYEKFSAENYYNQAEKLRTENKNKESIENYLKSIFINRNNPSSYLGLAIAYKNLKIYTKAIENLKKAEKLNPWDVKVQKELAMCNIIKGDFETGIQYLRSSIKLEPNNPDIQMQLALVHEMIEEEEMALMIYQRIIEYNPDYIRAYIQKATLYMHIEDYLNCAKAFKEVLKKDKTYYRGYLAIGICYEKMGNISGAKRYYKKYLTQNRLSENYKEIESRIKEFGKLRNTNKIKLKLVY